MFSPSLHVDVFLAFREKSWQRTLYGTRYANNNGGNGYRRMMVLALEMKLSPKRCYLRLSLCC